jgi:hypothetical protein
MYGLVLKRIVPGNSRPLKLGICFCPMQSSQAPRLTLSRTQSAFISDAIHSLMQNGNWNCKIYIDPHWHIYLILDQLCTQNLNPKYWFSENNVYNILWRHCFGKRKNEFNGSDDSTDYCTFSCLLCKFDAVLNLYYYLCVTRCVLIGVSEEVKSMTKICFCLNLLQTYSNDTT